MCHIGWFGGVGSIVSGDNGMCRTWIGGMLKQLDGFSSRSRVGLGTSDGGVRQDAGKQARTHQHRYGHHMTDDAATRGSMPWTAGFKGAPAGCLMGVCTFVQHMPSQPGPPPNENATDG
jgi:hypothetical protein